MVLDVPISFYGKVVDENNQPVSGASVHLDWKAFIVTPSHAATVLSDDSGAFSLTGKFGRQLYVSVEKSGYYGSSRNQGAGSFQYAGVSGEPFIPDQGAPILYYLRKKGSGVGLLITSQYGVRSDYAVKAPIDGTKVNIDLTQRKTGEGPMEISQVKPEYGNWRTATEWSFTVSIPEGGFVEENEEFAFNPPESGYQPVVEFNFQKGQANWTTAVQKDYYIKFGSPPLYGRVHIETSMESDVVRLNYVINPDGSRNLEPK
jgi:hypothetical protein